MKSKIKIKIVVTSPEEVLKARFIPCLCSETQFLFQNAKVLLKSAVLASLEPLIIVQGRAAELLLEEYPELAVTHQARKTAL